LISLQKSERGHHLGSNGPEHGSKAPLPTRQGENDVDGRILCVIEAKVCVTRDPAAVGVERHEVQGNVLRKKVFGKTLTMRLHEQLILCLAVSHGTMGHFRIDI
jgi:hypothetical protein